MDALLTGNVLWMGWNGILALVPLWLSVLLFLPPDSAHPRRSPGWWIGLAAFFAFLPNAPYVLTDLMHLPGDTSATGSELVELLLLCEYGGFVAIGLGAYVLSLRNLGTFLAGRGWSRSRILTLELVVHALSAVGVYLGRFGRFNSWDLATRPTAILRDVDFSDRALIGMAMMFVVLGVVTAVANAVLDDVVARHRRRLHRSW